MAKINTDAIKDFATMSDSDKLAALLALDIPDAVDLSQYVTKSTFDKTASELADKKRQLAERMGEDERKKEEADQAVKEDRKSVV